MKSKIQSDEIILEMGKRLNDQHKVIAKQAKLLLQQEDVLREIATMPEHDQDDHLRLRHKAALYLEDNGH